MSVLVCKLILCGFGIISNSPLVLRPIVLFLLKSTFVLLRHPLRSKIPDRFYFYKFRVQVFSTAVPVSMFQLIMSMNSVYVYILSFKQVEITIVKRSITLNVIWKGKGMRHILVRYIYSYKIYTGLGLI